MMPLTVTLSFMAATALAIQLLIFVYLYRSNRVPFFRYIVWAWGFYLGAKLFDGVRYFVPVASTLSGASLCLGGIGDFLMLAAALAFRGNYAIRTVHAVPVLAYTLSTAVYGPLVKIAGGVGGVGDNGGVVSGLVLIVAGGLFWPRPQESSLAGRRFLAVAVALWGLHRIGAAAISPGNERVFVAMNVSFVLIYYLVVFGIVIVVLDRARGEAAALKEFNERLIDGLGEGLQLVDDTFGVRHTNRWLVEQLHVTPGRRCYAALTADGRQCPGCPMAQRASLAAPVRLHVVGPADRRFELTCSPVRQPDGRVFLLELVADVTERERLQRRLTDAERLASVGELAAGVAHEIRNPLAAIVNATALLEGEETLAVDDRAAAIGAVRKEARRLNAILSDFLRFARPPEPKLVEADLRDVITHVTALVGEQGKRGPRIAVDTRVDADVPRFAFDPDQLTQVLWNVSLNAIESMKDGGRLAIHGRREGQEVVIEVADTGPGIPPEDLRRIFEPFYSRRAGGTGLGLAIARRIVTAHGGRIEVDTALGAGTRIHVRLPVS